MANKIIDGKVYNSNGQYLGSTDIVYGTGPIGNQKNKGITTGLDSDAIKNPQPSKMFNADSNRIPGADPKTPSTNPATRREKYNIGTSDVPQSTRIGQYDTVSSTTQSYYPKTEQTTEDYLGAIKKLPGFSYYTTDFDNQLREVQNYIKEQGIDATKEIYGDTLTEAAQQMATLNMQQGQLKAQENQVTNKQASNAKLVYTLAKEVWSGLAQGQSVQQIAQQLGQDERVIQKIANNETEELIQLNAEYEEEQLRTYLRNREDMDIQIARNITQYNNLQKNLDYQFNSAMDTLRRNLFDAEWTAKGTAAGLGMTGTEYVLNRIQTQYDQQMGDIRNTYDYQSANAQIAINEALEDYSKNLQRWAQDYAQARKGLQGYALQSLMNIENNIGLTADQMVSALTTAYKNIQAAQSNAMKDYLSAIEGGQSTLSTQIANAYGLTVPGAGTMRTERNNNPTAMTTDVAKSLGAVEGVDYIQGDKFPGDSKLYTARLLGDPIETTIKIFDNAAEKGIPIFYTKGGKQRWTYIAMSNDAWKAMTREQKEDVIASMLQHEGGSMSGMSYYAQNGADTTVTDEEIAAATNIYKADMDMLETVERFKEEYSKIGGLLDKNIDEIPTSLLAKATKIQMHMDGIDTIADLFYHATNAESSYYDKATNLLMKLGNPSLNKSIKLLRQITNKTFIQQLITAKGQGATFGNLTEGEGRRIESAYNELVGSLDYTSMIEGVDYLISNLANDLQYMNKQYGSNLKLQKKYGEQNVTPEIKTENDALTEIENTYGSGTEITPL